MSGLMSVADSLAPRTASGASPHENPWIVELPEDGMVVVRGATAARPEPDDWRDRFRATLRQGPGVKAVGAKRLGPDGRVFSMGEFVVHPKGFHHLGRGAAAEAYRFPEEVDAVAGGLLAVDGPAFEAAGGRDALHGQLGALELGLRVRRAGGRCVTIPDVVVEDCFHPDPAEAERADFQRRWGFDWRIADLDVVRRTYEGAGLLWNVRFNGRPMPFEKYRSRPAMHWSSYEQVEPFRRRADHLVHVAVQSAAPGSPGDPEAGVATGPVLDLGCGDGLFSHLLARKGLEVIGIDPEPEAIEQARALVARQQYPGPAPRFAVGRGEALPFDDGAMRLVVMFDVIEHLLNPAASLRAVARVLDRQGRLVVSTPAQQLGAWSDPVYHVCEYTMDELVSQLQAAGFEVATTGMIKGIYRDLVVVAGRAAMPIPVPR